VRLLVARSSVLMRAIKRSWDLHLVQRISIPNVRRKSSDQGIYLDVFLGLSCSAGAGAGAGSVGSGTTSLREVACDESTPKYLTTCLRTGLQLRLQNLDFAEGRGRMPGSAHKDRMD
jgi:hypothetical protein